MVPKKIQRQLLIPPYLPLLKLASTLLILLQPACQNPTGHQSSWTSWIKDVDSPGIHYRLLCAGKNFSGSKFTKWEVEVFNDYSEPLALTLAVAEAETGKESSEHKSVAIPPGSLKTVVFYNCSVHCQQQAQINFLEVQMLP